MPLKKLAEVTTKFIRARFQGSSPPVKIGYPQSHLKRATIFIVSELNHAIGVFYHFEKKVTYVYDSLNIGETQNPVRAAVEAKLHRHQVRYLHYEFHAKNDFCGSNLIAATVELVRWYRNGYIPPRIHPSPIV